MVTTSVRARNFLGVFAPVPPPPGGAIARLPFADNFESGNFNAWDAVGGTVSMTTLEAFDGVRSASTLAVNGQTSDNYLEFNFGDAVNVAGTPTGVNDLWIRFAHKWASSYIDTGALGVQKMLLLNIHNPATGARRYQMTFNVWTPDNGYFFEFLRWLEAGGANGVATANINLGLTRVKGRWEEFVFRVRMNNVGVTDGHLQAWTKVQGDTGYTQRLNLTNVNYRESTAFTPNRLLVSDFNTGTTRSGARYWDSMILRQEVIPTPPPTPPPPTDWADVFTNVAGADAQFTSAGRRVGIRGTTLADYAASNTPGNGGSITIIPNGSFDGSENAIHLVPPSAFVGENAQYVQFLSGLNVNNGGARTVKQINFSMLCRFAPRYIDLASGPKWVGWTLSQSTSAEVTPKRLAIFEGPLTQNGITGRVFGVTYGTTQSYNEPENGFFASSGTAAEKPVFIVNGPANHAADPPRIAALEWFHIEHVVTAPGHDAAAPNGRNRLYFRTADRVVDVFLDIPLSWGADYNAAIQYFLAIEFFGGYFNVAGAAHPDNWAEYCNPVISVNMPLNDRMGPPPGYLQ